MFSQFFIHRPIFACVISVLIMLIGCGPVPSLSFKRTSSIKPVAVSVTTTYPGASAEVVEKRVGAVIETQLNGMEGMIAMWSNCHDDGKYELTVTFEDGTDIDLAIVLIQNRVAIAHPKLPEEVKHVGVKVKKKSSAVP